LIREHGKAHPAYPCRDPFVNPPPATLPVPLLPLWSPTIFLRLLLTLFGRCPFFLIIIFFFYVKFASPSLQTNRLEVPPPYSTVGRDVSPPSCRGAPSAIFPACALSPAIVLFFHSHPRRECFGRFLCSFLSVVVNPSFNSTVPRALLPSSHLGSDAGDSFGWVLLPHKAVYLPPPASQLDSRPASSQLAIGQIIGPVGLPFPSKWVLAKVDSIDKSYPSEQIEFPLNSGRFL